jgi:hypothetical protein
MESEPIRDRASLLTSAHPLWCGLRLLRSPLTEDEAARVRSPPGKRVGACRVLWIVSTVFRPWRVNPQGGGRRPESGRARGSVLGLKTSALCSWMVNRPGGRRPFEAGRGTRRCLGLKASIIRWPRPSWSKGPA